MQFKEVASSGRSCIEIQRVSHGAADAEMHHKLRRRVGLCSAAGRSSVEAKQNIRLVWPDVLTFGGLVLAVFRAPICLRAFDGTTACEKPLLLFVFVLSTFFIQVP